MKKTFKTRNIYVAAAIATILGPPEILSQDSHGLTIFHWDNFGEARKLAAAYKSKELTINACDFVDSIFLIRDKITEKNTENNDHE